MATKQARIHEACHLIDELLESDWLHHQHYDDKGREVMQCLFCGAEGCEEEFSHDEECAVTRARQFIKDNHHD